MGIVSYINSLLFNRDFRNELNSRADEINSEFSAQEQRLNNLNSNSYPGANEVVRARTDVNGETYASLPLREDATQLTAAEALKVANSKADASVASEALNTANSKADMSSVTALQEQIAGFKKLADGSTTGDAELEDGRTDVFGGTRTNIGGAIRSQVNVMLERIQQANVGLEVLKGDFRIGTVVQGKFLTSVNYRVSSYSPLVYGRELSVGIKDGTTYRFAVHILDSDGNFVSDSGWLTTSYTVPANNKFMICIALVTENYLLTPNIGEFLNAIWVNSEIATQVKKLNELTSDIAGLIETVASQNIIDKSNLQNGYYNQNGFNADSNWWSTASLMPIGSATQLTGYVTSSVYVSYYTSNGSFIKSVSFTSANIALETQNIPDGAVYLRLSFYNNVKSLVTLSFGNIGTKNDEYYSLKKIDKSYISTPTNYYVVDQKTGRGDFNSIQQAVDAVPDYSTILIAPGTYEESLKLRGRAIHLLGLRAKDTIIVSTNDARDYPAAEMTAGSARNIKFYAKRPDGASDPSYATPYAVHIDFDEEANQNLFFDHCIFESDWQAAVGVGMRIGMNLKFSECKLISNNSSLGALFFHDSSKSNFAGKYSLTLDTCNLEAAGNYAIVCMGIGYEGNELDLTMLRNSLWSNVNGKNDAAIGIQAPDASYPTSTGSNFKGTATIKLNPKSFGNSANSTNS